MRKLYYVTAILMLIMISFLGITYSYEYSGDGEVSFELIGPSTLYLDIDTEYEEYGVKVIYNNHEVTRNVMIDSSEVDTSKLGKYKVKYEYNDEYVYRYVWVIDKVEPVIELMGGDEVYILQGGNFQEPGYVATDNCDGEITDKVTTSGSVNVGEEGTYKITYSVRDNSGNEGTAFRKVIVKKAVLSVPSSYNRVNERSYNVNLYSNTIIKNNFNISGIHYEGYSKTDVESYVIKLRSKENKEYSYKMTKTRNHYYSGDLKLTTVANGTYEVYLVNSKEEKLLNKLDVLFRIVRAKVGNKLVTVTYDNDYVTIKVEDFKYEYDVVINPGHGGSESGAANGLVQEKDVNLKVSNYEKCRYQSMGYKVYMTRYNDTYGELLGNNSLDHLDRSSLTVGYYGAVSRVVYSNHHNGSLNRGMRGFEIIAGNQIPANDLEPELLIAKNVGSIYGNSVSVYSRDYDTGIIHDKFNGQTYSAMNYYSIIRVPYELYNVKCVIYEPIYMTNATDFNWYYGGNNWIKISELKIKTYVEYMGGKYNPDNKNCL